MKQILKYGLGYLLTAALPASFIACSSEETFAELPSASYPASVVINIPAEVQPLVYTDNLGASVLPLVRGERIPLGYTIAPDNVTFKDVVWTSSNEAVASVDEAGNLTAVSGDGTGYSVIQVVPEAYYSGSNIASVLKVVVVNTLVETTSLTLSAPADEVYAGETLQFSLTIAPADATYKTVRWSSSDETVAKVDANGLVTGQMSSGNGAQATITATSLDGANITASKVITVNQIIQPEDITINQEYALAGG